MKKFIKISLYSLLSLLLIIVGLIVFLLTPAGQNFVTKQATNFLAEKIKTPFSVGKIKYKIPTSIGIEELLLIDNNKDTLAYLNYLDLRVNMFSLLNNKVNVKSLEIEGAHIYMHRQKNDTFFNYQYIVDAFSSNNKNESTEQSIDTNANSNPLNIEIVKTSIKNTFFRFNDQAGGTDFYVYVKDLMLKPNLVDLNALKFDIEELSINGVKSNLALGQSILPPTPPDTSASSPFLLNINKLKLTNAEYTMDMKSGDPMYLKVKVGELDGKLPKFDLLVQQIDASKLHLSDTRTLLIMGKSISTKEVVKEVEESISVDSLGWRITAQDVKLKNIQYQMDNNNEPVKSKGMDYAHMNVRDLFLVSDFISYTNDTIMGKINQLTLNEKSGLALQEFKTNFIYSNTGAILYDFLLRTPYTTLQNKLAINYKSLDDLSKNLGDLGIDILLENSNIGINDVLLFAPAELGKTLASYKNQNLAISTNLKGKLGNLDIHQLYLAGLNETKIRLNGKLTGLPDADKLRYNLNIGELRTTSQDINPFLPDSVKMMVSIPNRISANGKISGTVTQYAPNLKIMTSDGNAIVNGTIDLNTTGNERYDLTISTADLNLGKILKQDSLLGTLSTNIIVKGNSFDPKKMNTTLDLDVFTAQVLGYNYNSIKGKVNIEQGIAQLFATSADPNLDLTIDGTANLQNQYPELYAHLDMRNVDLLALNFVSDTLKLAGVLDINAPELNIDYPKATITGNELEVTLPGNKLPMDSIFIVASSDSITGQNIVLDIAKMVNLNLTGQIPLTQIPNAYMYHFDKYYHIGDTFERAANYNMLLDGTIRYNPILTRYDRKIKPFDTIKLNSSINPQAFDFYVKAPFLRYGNHKIDSVYVNILEEQDRINYNIGLKKYNNKDEFLMHYPNVSGRLLNDTIYARLRIKDTAAENRFVVGLAVNKDITQENSLTHIRIFKGLMIDYDLWNVNEANNITLGPNGFKVKDFFIKKDNQSIVLNSEVDSFNSPLTVKIDNFKLSTITKIIDPDTLLADGILNTNIVADLNPPIPFIKGNASITDLKVFETPFGNANLNATTKNENTYNALLTIDGNGNNVRLTGDYYLEPVRGNNFNFDLNISPLSLKSVEGLTFGNLKNSSGLLTGNLKLLGTFDKPKISGDLLTDNLQTTVSMINGTFLLPKEKISFTDKGIILDKVSIYDYRNKYATLDGRVLTRDFTSYFLNLNFTANDWSPINSTNKDFEMFYGKLFMSSNINLKGNATAPTITGDITVHDSTKLAFALIDSDPQIEETEGVVKFYDSRYPDVGWDEDSIDNVLNRVRFSQTAQMNVNVGVEKKAEFNLIIDPSTGDNLLVNGEAALNAQIAPNGTIGLAGNYALDDGYYELSFPPVKRKFKIQQGSVITLAGDPLDATVDITAVYKANVAPYDLVEKQVSNPADLVYYKQRLPFDVLLKLNGKALSPNITFDIVLPDGVSSVSSDVANTVQNKLSTLRTNNSEINKQVFALIVLNRFITDETFSSSNVVNVEYIARQSVSRFLSAQLNNLAGQFVSGLDINMDLEASEDYTTGQKVNRTDLNISASKSLFDDRLSITLGNDFLIEGNNNVGGKSSGIPGNLSADYKLTEDGKYILRGYRKNELQNLIDGYVVETGLGFRYSLQYNKFKYLFMNQEKLKERYRKYLEEERKIIEEKNKQTETNSQDKEEKPISSNEKAPVAILPQVIRAVFQHQNTAS